VCGHQPASREVMKYLQATTVFSYLLPGLRGLGPDEILRIRERVKDTREGFSLHLQKLSKGVEQRLQGGEPLEEAEKFARGVVETELLPDYGEFRRQLGAERSGRWKSVLDIAGKILSIDANPVTPKFWGQVLVAAGLPLGAAEAKKDQLSNRHQAFQF